MPKRRSGSGKKGPKSNVSLPKQPDVHTPNHDQVNIDSPNSNLVEGSVLVADGNDIEAVNAETADVRLDRAAGTVSQVAELTAPTSADATVPIAGSSTISQDSSPITSKATELFTDLDQPEISIQPNDELLLATDSGDDVQLGTSLDEESTTDATDANHSSLCEASQVQPVAEARLPIGTGKLDLDNNKPSKPDQEQSLLYGTQLLPLMVLDSDSGDSPFQATAGAIDSAIVISDDMEKTKRSPRKSRKASKRDFREYVESENLWMTSTLEDLDDILYSTRKQMKQLKATEDRLLAAQEFIRNCGAEEEKVTKRLEKSE